MHFTKSIILANILNNIGDYVKFRNTASINIVLFSQKINIHIVAYANTNNLLNCIRNFASYLFIEIRNLVQITRTSQLAF